MKSIPLYEGRPTAYLDQNILDVFIKYGLGVLGKSLVEHYQIVYSDETLKEIKRSKGFEDTFLNLLKNLNASYLKLIVEQPNYIITDKFTITCRDPFEVYDEYCRNSSDEMGLEYALQQWFFKFSGGRKGYSIADIHNEQIVAFSKLMGSITDNSKDLAVQNETIISQYKVSLEKIERLMLKEIPDDINWDGIKDFRNHFGIQPIQLNNIKPPNTLIKIWEQFKNKPPYDKNVMDIYDFFHLKNNPLSPEQPYYNHQKVAVIYNMLNTLGYWPDSGIHKEKRFIAAMSDNGHASMASFCQVLLSNDKNFIKKVNAAYEYLGITTLVKLVVITYE